MPNFSPLSSTVTFDDLLKANKQQFDSIFSAQTKELGLLGASRRPPTTADLASASLASEAAGLVHRSLCHAQRAVRLALVVGSGRTQNRTRFGDRAVQAHGGRHLEDAIRLGPRQRRRGRGPEPRDGSGVTPLRRDVRRLGRVGGTRRAASGYAPCRRARPRRCPAASAPAQEGRRLDTVSLDLIENALRNARHEMDAVLFRSAMSPGDPRAA